MFNYYLYLFEFGVIFTFAAILLKERKEKNILESLTLAALYGITLEIIDVHLSKSYFYGKDFLFQIYDVPIAIGVGWAVIYYCAKKTGESYKLKRWQEPFLMALAALSIDLAIDTVAIRLGFWSWRISMNQEWFGVPFDNLVGWMAVIWTFAFFMNLSEPFGFAQGRQSFIRPKFLKLIRYAAVIISPILLSLQITIYVTLAAIFSGRFTFGEIIKFYRDGDFTYAYYPEVQRYKGFFFILIVLVLAALLIKIIHAKKERLAAKTDYFSFWIVVAIHFFFLASIFTAGIYKEAPILIVVSAAMIIFHFAVSFFPSYAGNESPFSKQGKG